MAQSTTKRIAELEPISDEQRRAYRARLKHNLFRQLRALFRSLQEREDLTQKDIARRLQTDEALVSKRLRGESNLTIDTLCDLARAMEARIDVRVTPLREVRPGSAVETRTTAEGHWRRIAECISVGTGTGLTDALPRATATTAYAAGGFVLARPISDQDREAKAPAYLRSTANVAAYATA